MTLSRLVVGDDGSPGAAAARAWADALGRAAGAQVIVANSVEPGHARPVGPRSGRHAEAEELVGPAAPALLRFADEVEADLVVVGRRGAGGFEALALGSTAHQVAEHATGPIAVIPASTVPSGEAWPFATIAVGLDGSPAAADALTWVVPLAVESSATVVVVHALELAPMFAAAGLVDAYEQARRRISTTVEEWCAPLREAGVGYTTFVEEGGPADILLDAVHRHQADLLVVGRRSPARFRGMEMGSAAHRALGFAPCPTVVIPATDRGCDPIASNDDDGTR
jgi:nucleotide-binding universal stress UspA family protein